MTLVREDCRHYLRRTTHGGETMQRCRLGAAVELPFSCPEECLFFEPRPLSTAGWAKEADQPMSNTAWGLAALPPPRPRPASPGGRVGGGKPSGAKSKKKGRKGR